MWNKHATNKAIKVISSYRIQKNIYNLFKDIEEEKMFKVLKIKVDNFFALK